jgi:PAS domain-containing protein
MKFYAFNDQGEKEWIFSTCGEFTLEERDTFSSETSIGGRKWLIEGASSKKSHFWKTLLLYLMIGSFIHFSVLYFIYQLMKSREDLENRSGSAESWRTAVLNGADYSIISGNKEGVITVFNKAAEKMLGYTAEEMVGKNTPAIIHDINEVIAKTAEINKELNKSIEPGFRTFVEKSEIY